MARISCILYARSSKDGHDIAPATQLKELRAFAESKNYRVAAERKDAAVSANDDPPELAALLKELANPDRGWEVIVAIDSSRMARDVDAALHAVIQNAGGKTPEQAVEYVQKLRTEKRYQRDVY